MVTFAGVWKDSRCGRDDGAGSGSAVVGLGLVVSTGGVHLRGGDG